MSNPTLEHLLLEIQQLREEIASLKEKNQIFSQPGAQSEKSRWKDTVSTRRQTLKKLGMALLVGTTTATALGTVVTTQAKVIANPQTNGLKDNTGMVVLVPGSVAPSGTQSTPSYKYGLIACGDTTALDITQLPLTNVGVTGFGSGSSNSGVGVFGVGQTGVFGYSQFGPGVVAASINGASLFILPGPQPLNVTSKGSIYVDNSGNLHIYNGTEWRQVNTTAG